MTRLQEILVDKVSLETGIGRERVREVLTTPRLGQGLLRNDQLYMLLYNGVPAKGSARVKMLEDAIALVGSWKP